MSDAKPAPASQGRARSSSQKEGASSKGKRVGKYMLGDTLGQGTFAKVKLATDTETGKQFAVKILEKKQIIGQKLETQLKREISIMLKLRHPNVTQMVEVLQSAKNIYVVLELISSGELFDKIVSAKRFDETTARKYFQQLICGINYCHNHKIAHRDLKPENLLVDENDILKISDFGLSNLQKTTGSGRVSKHLFLKTVCGTPNYVAPEVLQESGYDGFMADLWSCGVILYVMLAGKLPFSNKDMQALFEQIKKAQYPPSQYIGEEAADLIAHLLTVDPAKRYSLVEISKHSWFRKDGWVDSRMGDVIAVTSPKADPEDDSQPWSDPFTAVEEPPTPQTAPGTPKPELP
jgi:serine/threonine protein kinase